MLLHKPDGNTYLNKDNALANGLQAAYLFNDKGESKIFDFARNQNILTLNNASLVSEGLECTTSNAYALLNNTDQVINSEACTLIFFIKSDIAISDSTLQYFGGFYVSGLYYFYLYKNSSGQLVFLMKYPTSRDIKLNSDKIPNWQTGTQIAFVLDRFNNVFDSKKMAVNIDGDFIVPDSATSATTLDSYTYPNNYHLFNRQHSLTVPINGTSYYTYIYNRALTEDEIRSIYEDPYSMFYSPTNISLGVLGSFKPGVSLQNNYYGANAFPIGRGL